MNIRKHQELLDFWEYSHRQGEDFPFTMEELDFLLRHEEEIPATTEKLDKEKLALLNEIGVVVRRITREQEKRAKEEAFTAETVRT